MKRSEMLRRLSLILFYPGDSNEKARYTTRLLDQLESWGMLPPPDNSIKTKGLGTLCQWEYEGENHE